MRRLHLFAPLLAVILAACGGPEDDGSAIPFDPARPDAFAQIQPILKQCFGCHGDRLEGGLDLRSHPSVMRGGKDGAAVVPGDPASSTLVQALRGQGGLKQMPYLRSPLSERQIQKIEAWIQAGAKE